MSLEHEAMLRGERPIHPDHLLNVSREIMREKYASSGQGKSSVSCLTPKYQKAIDGDTLTLVSTATKHDSVFMEIHDNKSIFTLPGQGEQTNDKCGQWTHPLRCPNHGQVTLDGRKHDSFVATHSCNNSNCPVCYESWASRQAANSSDRIIQAIGLYRHAGYVLGNVKHVVFSPPQELAKELHRTTGGFKTLRTMAKQKIREAGMSAGAVIYHPFRQNDPREDNFNPEMQPYVWYESPHFHVIGTGWIKKSNEFYEQTGWTYKNIGRRETIKGTIKYTLTHCGICEGLQAVTYFGLFSNNKIVIDKIEKVTEAIKCQACGQELHLYGTKEGSDGSLEVDWTDDKGVYLHVVVKKTYRLKGITKRDINKFNIKPLKKKETEQSRLKVK